MGENTKPESNLQAMTKEELEELKLRQQTLENASVLFDEIVYKAYLSELSKSEIIPYAGKDERIRWYQITKIVYEKDVFFTDKMAMLYASLHNVSSVVSLAIKKRNGKMELYIGTRDEEGTKYVSGKILDAGIKGVLPGIDIKLKDTKVFEGFKDGEISVSCVSGVGSLTDDKKEHFIQGVENLINATKEIQNFTALIIASKVSYSDACSIQSAYENLYSEISSLAQVQLSYNVSESKGVTKTLTEGFNHSVSENISKTISHSTSESKSIGQTKTKNSGWNAGLSVIVASAGRSGGSSIANSLTDTVGSTEGIAEQNGQAVIDGKNKSEANAESKTQTTSKTIQLTKQNRYIKSSMDVLDRQIERIRKSAPLGLWSVATYFVANDDTTSQELAGIYRGIIVGDKSEVETVSINHWPRNISSRIEGNPTIDQMMSYLKNQLHPVFKYKGDIPYTAGSLVDSKELAIHLSLPQSSVPGLLVREEKAFGRDVKAQIELTEENSVSIGHVMHLGELYPDEVMLGINGLSKHVFVTGTTGSGKSNTLYLLLSELVKKEKKFLIIEPAKGEYKEVFGNHEKIKDVTVYGTNPRMSKLLCINPFEFPKDIDVYEHIDSLVEIFNACWPMYAAMPQVMKHSIMEAYKSCGWDLSRSENTSGIYPTIEDVLYALKDYINSSEYSSDTKGDYKGSLETRLQSLCEGLVGRMFHGNPISDEDLFNSNVIVDLSRVKSSETKSLLMGLLIMKLNEFRASEKKGMNQELRHVTILEEAHNLLKRTSTDQSAESSNVAGMAVEKIANSMAEMRTYGEGFIIADQSPSMLDLATIRNTNTKIIMALPEKDDREIAGKAIGLNDQQIPEISRLKTGEAIVYQNGWEEPVKTKIHEYKQSDSQPWNYQSTDEEDRAMEEVAMKRLFDMLYEFYALSDTAYTREDLLEQIISCPLSGRKKALLLDKVNAVETPMADDCASMMAIIIGTDLCQQLQQSVDIISMNIRLFRELQQRDGLRETDHIETFANMYVRGCSMEASEPFYEEWQERTAKSYML